MGSGASKPPATVEQTTQIVVKSKNLEGEEGPEVEEEMLTKEDNEIMTKSSGGNQNDGAAVEVEEIKPIENVSSTPTQIVIRNDDIADEDKPEHHRKIPHKSFAQQLVSTLTKSSPPPPPAFNLPVAGWSKDPEILERALQKRRKHLKVVKVKVKKEKASHKVTNNGPLLDWACLGIRDIPNTDLQFFKSRTSVDLSHNPLNQLPVGIGTQEQLQHLNLHDCDFTLEGLPQSLFSGLLKLTVLDLSCNILDEITEEFGSLCSLKRLILHSNRIERIDDAIALCPLEHLEVQNNQLTSLPPGLVRLRNLGYLDAENNKIDFLPIFFGRGRRGKPNTRNLQTVKRLNLGSNHLSELPPGLAGMDMLESLWLQRNHIFDLPSDLGDMKGLKQLCAFGNHIKALPDSCSGLTSLVTLALNDNGIGPLLSESMFGMTALVSLDLSDNKIETLPMRFGELSSLKHFWCSRNRIETLPASIGTMTQLESLHLHENSLSILPPNVGGWANLKVLTLARNKLEHLPPTFRLLVSLQRMTLDHNTTMTYMAEDGKFFKNFICLSSMTIDKSVFKLIDEEVKLWCKSHIPNLKVMNTPTSKAKLRAQLLEASGFKSGGHRHDAHL